MSRELYLRRCVRWLSTCMIIRSLIGTSRLIIFCVQRRSIRSRRSNSSISPPLGTIRTTSRSFLQAPRDSEALSTSSRLKTGSRARPVTYGRLESACILSTMRISLSMVKLSWKSISRPKITHCSLMKLVLCG